MTNVTVQVKGVQLKASTGKMHKRGASPGNRKDYIRLTANCRKFYSESPTLKKFMKNIYAN